LTTLFCGVKYKQSKGGCYVPTNRAKETCLKGEKNLRKKGKISDNFPAPSEKSLAFTTFFDYTTFQKLLKKHKKFFDKGKKGYIQY
jgi:hypothetical protein